MKDEVPIHTWGGLVTGSTTRTSYDTSKKYIFDDPGFRKARHGLAAGKFPIDSQLQCEARHLTKHFFLVSLHNCINLTSLRFRIICTRLQRVIDQLRTINSSYITTISIKVYYDSSLPEEDPLEAQPWVILDSLLVSEQFSSLWKVIIQSGLEASMVHSDMLILSPARRFSNLYID